MSTISFKSAVNTAQQASNETLAEASTKATRSVVRVQMIAAHCISVKPASQLQLTPVSRL